MVRYLVILLTLMYGFSATGATVYLHYCCGTPQKIAATPYEKTDHDDCPLCTKHDDHHEPPTTSDCCDKTSCDVDSPSLGGCKNLKIEAKKTTEEHIASGQKIVIPKLYPLELAVFTAIHFLDSTVISIRSLAPVPDADIPLAAVPLFIQHCTYRI